MFVRPAACVASRLAARDTYAFFGPAKLLPLMPALVAFAPTLRRWRDAAEMAATFLSFPPEAVRPSWRAVAAAMCGLFARHPAALAAACADFVARFAAMLEGGDRGEFLKEALAGFGGSPAWGVRRLVAPAVHALAATLPPPEVARMHPHLRMRLADPVPAVVASVFVPICKLKQFYGEHNEGEFEREAMEIFASGNTTGDVFVLQMWRDAWAVVEVKLATTHLPRLTAGAIASERKERTQKSGRPPVKAIASLPGMGRRTSLIHPLAQTRRRTVLGSRGGRG
jgi:hypothetical protein